MDSMTDDELDSKVKLTETRIKRVARGAGQSGVCSTFVKMP